MRERLRRVGSHSISGIVDITNYVMLELGAPLHAYDLARLSGGLVVRMAKNDERIALLNGNEYTLSDEFLIIADATGPVGLAGIMGGRPTAISAATTDVLLEAAHFVPEIVAGRARRLGLFTDAGQRFERGVDPELATAALERATDLLLQCAGGVAGPVQATRLNLKRRGCRCGAAA
jgi:phenylalanyl-tRNA synthetase beta chain